MKYPVTPFLIFLSTAAVLAETPRVVSHPGNDRYANWSPDGEHIVFESDREGNWDVFVLEVQTGEISRVVTSSRDERYPSWHPDGQHIL